MKESNIRNIYFCYRDVGTALDYSILVNVEEKDKTSLYDKEHDGYNVVKVLANETGD